MTPNRRELHNAIKDAESAADSLCDDLDTAEAERDALEKERDDLLETVSDLRAELADRDARIATLEAEANDLTDRLLEVDSSL